MKQLKWIYLLGLAATAVSAAESIHSSTHVSAEFLWWQVRESGAENWAELITVPGPQRSVTLIQAPFNWNAGIRLGLDKAFNDNSYDVALIYTHYQTKAKNSAAGVVYSAFDGNYFANNTNGASFGPHFSQGNIRWLYYFNTLDLNLGKQFIISPYLELHPYIGMRIASINQSIYTNWYNPINAANFTSATENLKNDFWGIGPTIGVNSTWPLFHAAQQTVSLIGNLGLGMLWGNWKLNDIYANNIPVTITVYQNSITGASPFVDGLLGLQWTKSFADSELGLRLGYEAQVFNNQVAFYSLSYGKISRPTSLQGGNVEIHFNC